MRAGPGRDAGRALPCRHLSLHDMPEGAWRTVQFLCGVPARGGDGLRRGHHVRQHGKGPALLLPQLRRANLFDLFPRGRVLCTSRLVRRCRCVHADLRALDEAPGAVAPSLPDLCQPLRRGPAQVDAAGAGTRLRAASLPVIFAVRTPLARHPSRLRPAPGFRRRPSTHRPRGTTWPPVPRR